MLILALDFGGTRLSLGLVNRGARRWLAHRRVYTPAGGDAATDLHLMRAAAHALLGDRQPAAVGVSFGGPVRHSTGEVRLSHHVPGWEHVPLGPRLQEMFAAPATVDNDANAAALGEHVFGRDRAFASLLYVTVSTGVGGGWVLNGDVWRGADEMAGEIGHTVVQPDGPHCLCGKRGCVERLASGPYMAQDAERLLAEEPAAGRLLRELRGAGPLTGEMISAAAAQGDELADRLLLRGAQALGAGLANAANLLNPALIVLGGGVTRSGPRWWQAVREAVAAGVLPEINARVEPAVLGADAPLWGAVALAQRLPGLA